MFRCPTCGSSDIFPVAGGYLGSIYLCHACGYRGSLIVEVDPPEEEERD